MHPQFKIQEIFPQEICKSDKQMSAQHQFVYLQVLGDDDDEIRFNDTSTHEGHLHQNSVLTSLEGNRSCINH